MGLQQTLIFALFARGNGGQRFAQNLLLTPAEHLFRAAVPQPDIADQIETQNGEWTRFEQGLHLRRGLRGDIFGVLTLLFQFLHGAGELEAVQHQVIGSLAQAGLEGVEIRRDIGMHFESRAFQFRDDLIQPRAIRLKQEDFERPAGWRIS